jgi:hypothetical protein
MTDMTTAPPSTGTKNSTMAIVSLIAGIVGLTLLPLIGSVTALITGYMARKEIRESAGALSGDGMALAGVIMGWIGVAFAVFGLCMACFFFALLPLGIIQNAQYGWLAGWLAAI